MIKKIIYISLSLMMGFSCLATTLPEDKENIQVIKSIGSLAFECAELGDFAFNVPSNAPELACVNHSIQLLQEQPRLQDQTYLDYLYKVYMEDTTSRKDIALSIVHSLYNKPVEEDSYTFNSPLQKSFFYVGLGFLKNVNAYQENLASRNNNLFSSLHSTVGHPYILEGFRAYYQIYLPQVSLFSLIPMEGEREEINLYENSRPQGTVIEEVEAFRRVLDHHINFSLALNEKTIDRFEVLRLSSFLSFAMQEIDQQAYFNLIRGFYKKAIVEAKQEVNLLSQENMLLPEKKSKFVFILNALSNALLQDTLYHDKSLRPQHEGVETTRNLKTTIEESIETFVNATDLDNIGKQTLKEEIKEEVDNYKYLLEGIDENGHPRAHWVWDQLVFSWEIGEKFNKELSEEVSQ